MALKGKKLTEEHKRKISKSLKGRHLLPQQGFQKGHKVSKEVRKKVSKAHKGKPSWNKGLPKEKHWNFGKHLSNKTKKKISKAHKGIKLSKEHRKHLSEAKKGCKVSHSQETRRKISKANKGRKLSKKWRQKIGKANKGKLKGKNHPNWKGGYENKLWHNRQRRIKKLEAEGSHTQGEWELLKKQYGYMCPCCRKKEPKIKLTEDHIIPLSRGGSDYIENIQPLCSHCNFVKHIKIIKYKR